MKIIEELLMQFSLNVSKITDKIYTVSISKEKLRQTVVFLKNNEKLLFDFLVDIIGVDYEDSFGVIYNLSSTQFPAYTVLVKTHTNDRKNPHFDSIFDLWQSAGLYEREIHDFFGIKFINNVDMRRLFLRQDWCGYPFRKDYDPSLEVNHIPFSNENLTDMEKINDGDSIFEKNDFVVNFGPQHPSTHGVLHLRIVLDGEIIKKIDPNFGYIHRGIEKMCETYTYQQLLHLTERLDYLSGSINRHGMCLVVEKGLGLEVPDRASYVRIIIDELTRIASHLLGWGCMAMDMGSITAFIYGMRDRENIMSIFEETCGARLMANYNVIGGIINDIHPNFQRKIKRFIPYMRKMLKEHHFLFTNNPIANGRMKNVGYLSKEQAISLGATGPTGRASGWSNDVRKIDPYSAYKYVDFKEILRTDGLTFDRYIVRLDEIEESLKIIEQLIDNIPSGAYVTKTKTIIKLPEGEFYQRVEGARGEFSIFICSRGDKYPYRVKFRSPCIPLVNALKSIAIGTKIADLVMLGGSLDYVVPCIDR
ncbi:MAG: NADH-quinone oxidoreductase subunit D [Bacteroidales bacterium OttesenSCG-928-I14]|jgi:NADH-quinone oxidoreductase subunit C/D|nr:NADH-quinone oxidoreductase subunit D [Bacteroidales bacterium OttesenSCG-928-I14]